MVANDLNSMPLEELLKLHEELTARLGRQVKTKLAQLDERLRQLRPLSPSPKVSPKYQSPENPTQTWSGRGKQPRWLTAQLRAGKKLTDFLAASSEGVNGPEKS
jgi:DNA-binding protein H-NS